MLPTTDKLTVAGGLSVRAARRLVRAVLLAAFCLAAGLALTRVVRERGLAAELPRLGRIPAFRMVNQDGQTVGDLELRGRPFIADFFYASCTTSCPRLTAEMLGLYRAFSAPETPVHLVSITLDPVNDTPQALNTYAQRLGVAAQRWSFLSGRDADLNRVVGDGFKLYFERPDDNAGVSTIMHGEWLVLVDASGEIRGYYQISDDEHMADLPRDARALAGESR